MPFKLNPLTGQLDLVNPSISPGSGNVTGFPPTDIGAIARWADTAGTEIENSAGTFVQDSGAIQMQASLSDRVITGQVDIPTDYSMLASNVIIETTGQIIINVDAELLIL